MKSTIYVVRNKRDGETRYLTEYKINSQEMCDVFNGNWSTDIDKAIEFENKADAVALASRLKNNWNGYNYKAVQKCKCKK